MARRLEALEAAFSAAGGRIAPLTAETLALLRELRGAGAPEVEEAPRQLAGQRTQAWPPQSRD